MAPIKPKPEARFTLRADEVPPGSCCGYCAVNRHLFVHPTSIPGSLWRLEDGCPCCETHIAAPGESILWPSLPPLGVSS